MDFSHAFLILAAMCNCVAAYLNIRLSKRARRNVEYIRTIQATAENCMAFAGYLSTEESGAPPNVRQAARACFPPDATITATKLTPASATRH